MQQKSSTKSRFVEIKILLSLRYCISHFKLFLYLQCDLTYTYTTYNTVANNIIWLPDCLYFLYHSSLITLT